MGNEHIQNTKFIFPGDQALKDLYGMPCTREQAGITRLGPGPTTLIELCVHVLVDVRISSQNEQGQPTVEVIPGDEKLARTNLARRLVASQITKKPTTITRMEVAAILQRAEVAYNPELFTILHERLTGLAPVAAEDPAKTDPAAAALVADATRTSEASPEAAPPEAGEAAAE